MVGGGVRAHYGINIDLSRYAGTVDGVAIWIVAGSAGACTWTVHDGGVCAPTSLVTTQGLFGAQVPVCRRR
jgi:hypothetical protein